MYLKLLTTHTNGAELNSKCAVQYLKKEKPQTAGDRTKMYFGSDLPLT